LGDEAIGGISPLIYSAAIDTPVSRRFVKEYRARYGKVPSYYSESCYTTGQWINDAAKSIGGDVEDREKFLAALRKVAVPDERRAIIGPNGAGKTTLFSLISGETRPTVGRIALFDRDVTRLSPHRRAALGLARTYQITNLFPRLTALENCLLAVQALTPVKLHLHRALTRYPALFERARGVLDAVGRADKEGAAAPDRSHG